MFAIAVDIGLARVGYGLVLPAIRHDLGGAYATYGAIGAVHLGGYLIGTLAAPRALRDPARVPLLIAVAQFAIAVCLVWSAFVAGPVELGLARFVLGIATGFGIAGVVFELLRRVAPRGRGAASGLAWSGIGVGLVLSAPAGPWSLAVEGAWRTATLLTAACAFASALAALALPPLAERTGGAIVRFDWIGFVVRRNPGLVLGYASFGAGYIAYATFAVALFAARGVAPTTVAWVWAVLGLACTIGSFGIGRVLSGSWRRYALVLPLVSGAIGAAISAAASDVAALLGALFCGLGFAATPAVASAFARERAPEQNQAHAFAAVTTVFGVAQIVGPLAAGLMADRLGLTATSIAAAAIFLIGAVAATLDARASSALR
jgi:predicted MFS family arabinose efflux permease